MGKIFKEKRKHPRIEAHLPVILVPEQEKDPLKDMDISDTKNISLGGVCIPVRKHIPNLNQTFQISLFIPADEKEHDTLIINSKGKVVRREESENPEFDLASIKFLNIGQKYKTRLGDYIKRVIQ